MAQWLLLLPHWLWVKPCADPGSFCVKFLCFSHPSSMKYRAAIPTKKCKIKTAQILLRLVHQCSLMKLETLNCVQWWSRADILARFGRCIPGVSFHAGIGISLPVTLKRIRQSEKITVRVTVCFCHFVSSLSGRWYIREGLLKVVPHKGAEAKPKMFFLFSDMLLQAKRCSPLHPTNADKFEGQHAYPLQDCSVEKVFGHTRSRGGLLSVSANYPAT